MIACFQTLLSSPRSSLALKRSSAICILAYVECIFFVRGKETQDIAASCPKLMDDSYSIYHITLVVQVAILGDIPHEGSQSLKYSLL